MSYKPVGIDEDGYLPPRAMYAIKNSVLADIENPETAISIRISERVDDAVQNFDIADLSIIFENGLV